MGAQKSHTCRRGGGGRCFAPFAGRCVAWTPFRCAAVSRPAKRNDRRGRTARRNSGSPIDRGGGSEPRVCSSLAAGSQSDSHRHAFSASRRHRAAAHRPAAGTALPRTACRARTRAAKAGGGLQPTLLLRCRREPGLQERVSMTKAPRAVVTAWLAVAGTTVAASAAAADVSKSQCVDANTLAQSLRRQGKFEAARESPAIRN